MMREVKAVSARPAGQEPGVPFRRWFEDDYFDLIVWYDGGGAIEGFQLCYDKPCEERVLTWHRERGFSHDRVDGGEESPLRHMSPMLVPAGGFPAAEVVERFEVSSEKIDVDIVDLVVTKLNGYSTRANGI